VNLTTAYVQVDPANRMRAKKALLIWTIRIGGPLQPGEALR